MAGYAITAQYYDPLAAAAHAHVDRQIAEALAGLDPLAGPIVDIGAGTGLTTALIAATMPEAEIFAIEPDPAMRSALMTRVWSAPDLRERVTILPCGVLDSPLPGRLAGAVLSASLVHFAPDDRAKLWILLAGHIEPNGRIIVEVQCPVAEDFPETEMANAQVGRILYRGTAAAERISADRQRWHMTYRQCIGDRELRCDRASYECWAISADRVMAEARAAGLDAEALGDLVIMTSR